MNDELPNNEPSANKETPPVAEPVAPSPFLIPRINISVFCCSAETTNILQSAAADRRMAKAHLDIQQGGIEAAIEHHRKTATPNLLIVEVGESRQELLQQLNLLAQVCGNETNVLIIGVSNDIELYRELLARGVSEYLVAPITIVDIFRAISSIYANNSSPPLGRSVGFFGVRGGVGASTISHNVAFTIANRCNSDVLLMDLDLAFGTVNIDFDRDSQQTIAEALASSSHIDDNYLDRLLVKCDERLSLLTSPSSLAQEYNFSIEAYRKLLEVATATTPNIILDIPHIWSDWSRELLLMCDEIILVASRDLASLRNAKNLLDYLAAKRPNDKRPLLVLNMDGAPKRPELPLADFTKPLDMQPVVTFAYDGGLFGQAMNNGQMVAELSGKGEAAASFYYLANILLGRDGGEKTSKKFFAKLLGSK